MDLVFLGSSEFGVPVLRSLLHDGHHVSLVITQPDRPKGRGRRPAPTPIKALAVEQGLPVIAPPKVNDPAVVRKILDTGARLGVVVAFGQMIGRAIRDGLPSGCVNLHGSLLPKYRGAAPVNWAIINGETTTGVTVFRLVREMDAGPMLITRSTAIGDEETADDLHWRLARIGCDAVRETLKLFADGAEPAGEPQDQSAVSLAPKLTKADGLIRFDVSALHLARRINGLSTWPGARCLFCSGDGGRREPVTLIRAVHADADPAGDVPGPPGTIAKGWDVQAANGHVQILEIQPAGRRIMEWDDFVNGRHVRPGDRFEALTEPR